MMINSQVFTQVDCNHSTKNHDSNELTYDLTQTENLILFIEERIQKISTLHEVNSQIILNEILAYINSHILTKSRYDQLLDVPKPLFAWTITFSSINHYFDREILLKYCEKVINLPAGPVLELESDESLNMVQKISAYNQGHRPLFQIILDLIIESIIKEHHQAIRALTLLLISTAQEEEVIQRIKLLHNFYDKNHALIARHPATAEYLKVALLSVLNFYYDSFEISNLLGNRAKKYEALLDRRRQCKLAIQELIASLNDMEDIVNDVISLSSQRWSHDKGFALDFQKYFKFQQEFLPELVAIIGASLTFCMLQTLLEVALKGYKSLSLTTTQQYLLTNIYILTGFCFLHKNSFSFLQRIAFTYASHEQAENPYDTIKKSFSTRWKKEALSILDDLEASKIKKALDKINTPSYFHNHDDNQSEMLQSNHHLNAFMEKQIDVVNTHRLATPILKFSQTAVWHEELLAYTYNEFKVARIGVEHFKESLDIEEYEDQIQYCLEKNLNSSTISSTWQTDIKERYEKRASPNAPSIKRA